MKEKFKRFISYLGKREFLLLLTFVLAFYFVMERIGLFRLEPATWREVFHSMPVRALSVLFAVNALTGSVLFFRESKGWGKVGNLFFYISVLVLVAGLWTSVYSHFEGRFLRTEGQTFSGFGGDYIENTVYTRDEENLPQLGLNFHKIRPEAARDMKRIERISADVSYSSRTTKRIIDKTITSDFPLISDWTIARIIDFGYTPKFVLNDLKGEELERKYLSMKLFPAGAEDQTEAMFLGYLFYIKLYPDYFDDNGKPDTKSPYINNPVFNLRIVRNKDIVYNGLVTPTEKIRFDNIVISLPEVKMCVEMSLVRDLGLPVAAAGLVAMMLGVGMMWVGGRGKDG